MKAFRLLLHQVIVLLQNFKWIQNSKKAVEFRGSFMKQDKVIFTHKNVVNFSLPMN